MDHAHRAVETRALGAPIADTAGAIDARFTRFAVCSRVGIGSADRAEVCSVDRSNSAVRLADDVTSLVVDAGRERNLSTAAASESDWREAGER